MRRLPLLLGACTALAGCTLPTAADQLSLVVLEESVEVDLLCETGGCEAATVTLELTLEDADWMSDEASFELRQHRVDFDGVDPSLPYYANETTGTVPYGDSLQVIVEIAGPAQREAAYALEDGGEVAGTATITVAGIDYNEGVYTASADFEVVFANLGGSAEDTGGNL